MHPNDTLNGALLEFEREDQKHLRRSLGYWRMVERRMIRAALIEEGAEPSEHAISKRVTENHANDESYRETSARLTRYVPPNTTMTLTIREWLWLADRLEGTNHPVGQAILAKALKVPAP